MVLGCPKIKIPQFEGEHIYLVFTLILYLFTIFLNLALVVTIFLKEMLRTPMYLFLCNLCVNGIIGASAFYPKILHDILFDSHVITYSGCMTQIFFIFLYREWAGFRQKDR
uniref:G-protein coupled receptors family 1 profile domain-containing protein n=1 Tax=Esox lucius TaxID=8010 RepID=A0AAY5LAD7_ESOLU